jgi:hypothetical protein
LAQDFRVGYASEVKALLLQVEVDPLFIVVEGLELVVEELELYSFSHM